MVYIKPDLYCFFMGQAEGNLTGPPEIPGENTDLMQVFPSAHPNEKRRKGLFHETSINSVLFSSFLLFYLLPSN